MGMGMGEGILNKKHNIYIFHILCTILCIYYNYIFCIYMSIHIYIVWSETCPWFETQTDIPIYRYPSRYANILISKPICRYASRYTDIPISKPICRYPNRYADIPIGTSAWISACRPGYRYIGMSVFLQIARTAFRLQCIYIYIHSRPNPWMPL